MEELTRQQLDRFASEGITPSPADAIRLDEAARRLCRAKSADGTQFFPAPRVRWCGGVILHEPTVQSELWIAEVADALAPRGWIAEKTGAADLTRFWMRVFALAHADEPRFFDAPEMRKAETVREAVNALRRSMAATMEEVEDAVLYCVYGDAEEAAAADSPRRHKAPSAADMTRRDRMYADLAEAIGITGAAIDDLKRLTPAMLERATRRAWELNEWKFKQTESSAALVAWHKVCDEIKVKTKDGKE